MTKRKTEVVTPPRNTRAKLSQAEKGKEKMPEEEAPQKREKVSFACRSIRVKLPEEPARLERLRKNMKKMGCEGLLDVAWHHEEPAWLTEVWCRDPAGFPNTIRSMSETWREDLMGKVFGLERDGVPLPTKIKGTNYAAEFFSCPLNPKEGWKFLECAKEELRDLFEFLTPLINPMKPTRITGKLASRVVENLYYDKPVSWAQILEDVIAQQVKTMGPKSPKVCLAGYLAPIYKHEGVLTLKEKQNYRLTERGGDPDEMEKEEEDFETGEGTEVESDPEPDTDSAEAASAQEEEPATQEAGPPESPPQEKPEEEVEAGSREEEPATQRSPSPEPDVPEGPPGGQEAQAACSQDPGLGLWLREWGELQNQGLGLTTGYDADMHLAKQAEYIGGFVSHLQHQLEFRARDWEKMGKFLGCAATPLSITSTVVKLVDERKLLLSRIEELEEKRGNLEKDYQENMDELTIRRRQVKDLTTAGECLRRERDLRTEQKQQAERTVGRLTGELQSARRVIEQEEGIQRSLQAATEATSRIFDMDKHLLIKKKLQMVHKGENKPFKLLYQTIQDFTNDIIDVEVNLQQEVKATREYLKEKYQPVELPKPNPAQVGKVSIALDSSEDERELDNFIQTLDKDLNPAGIPGDQPESSGVDQPDSGRQLVPFQPSEEVGERAADTTQDFIPLHEEPASLQPPQGDVEAVTQVGKAG